MEHAAKVQVHAMYFYEYSDTQYLSPIASKFSAKATNRLNGARAQRTKVSYPLVIQACKGSPSSLLALSTLPPKTDSFPPHRCDTVVKSLKLQFSKTRPPNPEQ